MRSPRLRSRTVSCFSTIDESCLQSAVERTNQLLHSDLDARVLDLGRERHNTEQLQKSLNTQNEAHRELIATLKKAQTAIVDELTKEGSVLAGIVNSENSIQTKYYTLSNIVTQC